MKKVLSILLFVLSGLSFAIESNYLFLQGASEGSIHQLEKNIYLITFKKSDDYVSYFTDRPARESGMVKLNEFLNLWRDKKIKNNFADNPPNVAMMIVTSKGQRYNAIGIVTKPVNKNGEVSYHVQPIDKKPLPIGKLSYIGFFFDDISWNPGGF